SAIFLTCKTAGERPRIDAGDRQHVIRPQVIQIQPEDKFAEKLNGRSRRDAVVIQPRRMRNLDIIGGNTEITDQKLFDTFCTADRFTEAFGDLIDAMRVLVKQDVTKTRGHMGGDFCTPYATIRATI